MIAAAFKLVPGWRVAVPLRAVLPDDGDGLVRRIHALRNLHVFGVGQIEPGMQYVPGISGYADSPGHPVPGAEAGMGA